MISKMNESRHHKHHLHLPSCSQCHKNYDIYYHVPRLLKCGHTFCEKCISSHHQNRGNRKVYICSECLSQTVIRRNIKDDLPENKTIIDIIHNMKKDNYLNEQIEAQCNIHKKIMDMVCYTCDNCQICAHCALFGQHKGHEIGSQALASKSDVKDLEQYLNIIGSSIQLTILPQSPQNIEQKCKKQLREGLKKIIKIKFKQYYDRISDKQKQLLKQSQQISIQGNISNNIDRILTSYHNIKIWFENHYTNISLNQIEQVMQKAKNIHDQIEQTCEHFDKNITQYLKQTTKKISQIVFFKVHQLPTGTLKDIITEKSDKMASSRYSSNKKQNISQKINRSGVNVNKIQRQTQHRSLYYNSVVSAYDQDDQILITQHQIKNHGNKLQSHPVSPIKKHPQIMDLQLSGIKKINSQQDNTNKAINRPPRNPVKNINQSKVSISKKSELKPSTSRSTNKMQQSKLHSKSQKGQSKQKDKIKQNNFMNNTQGDDLVYISPLKQIGYEHRIKFLGIIQEIERQSKQSNNSLELINLQINDLYILHICDYLKNKRIQFSMIKLVKNSITDEGLKILLCYLVDDNFTKVLNMTGNHLTNKCLDYITKFISKNNILKSIYLANNKISPMQLKKRKNVFDSNFVEVII